MRLKTKLFLDRNCGRMLCWILAPLVRGVGLLWRRDHSASPERVRTIIAAKYFGLGSIIHSRPMLLALRERFPEARLLYLTRRGNAALFGHIPEADELILIDDGSLWRLLWSMAAAVLKMWRLKVDLFFDLEVYSAFGALISLCSLARNRVGFYAGRPSDYKSFLYNNLVYLNANMPVRFCYLQLARTAGVAADAPMTLPELPVSGELLEQVKAKLTAMLPGDGPVLAININASELSLSRRWLPERFCEVAHRFAAEGYRVFFVGSADERAYVERAIAASGGDEKFCNAAGKFTLSEFLAFLKLCRALLTNDAGIMNMGYAQHLPTVSLWGPGEVVQYHLFSPRTRAIKKPLYCSPCLYIVELNSCAGEGETPPCMRMISVDEVAAALHEVIDCREPWREEPFPLPGVSPDGAVLGLLYSKAGERGRGRNSC